MTTQTFEEIMAMTDIAPYEEPTGNADHKAHIVNPPRNLHLWQPGMTSQEMVDIARSTKQEIVALCGYRWVPKMNPDKFPVCDVCMSIAGELMRSKGE